MQVILTTLIACGLLHYGQSFLGHSEPLEAPLGYVPSNAHVFKEAIPHFSSRRDIVQRSILQPDHVHQLEFVLQLRNMDELERIVHDIANPLSANYGQHMSAEQVNAMTMNPEGRDAIVNYLHANGATVVGETLNSEFITATAPISVWNKVLHTEFSLFHQEKYDGKIEQQVRAETYSIPNELDDHVTCVLNAVDLPVVMHGGVILPLTNHEVKLSAEMHTSANPAFYTGWILPKILTKYYNVTGYSGSAQSTQAVYGGNEDYFSPGSLAYFQREVAKIPVQAAIIKNGYASEDPTKDYSEGNLDIQYLMSVSQKSPTTYWHTYTGVGLWLRDVLLTTNIPLVLSISYGAEEKYTSMGEHQTFTTAAIKMAATGITITAAAGDDGANTRKSCSYSPIYPASNPYVLSIGATAGAEWGIKETVCQWDNRKGITSGGGFSVFYTRPSWQDAAVTTYFKNAIAEGKNPVGGYAAGGRGYPDISLAGANYFIWLLRRDQPNGFLGGVAGTSASCPVAAAFISNINAGRLAAGKGPVGWFNPTLNLYASKFTNDVTSGNNKCYIGGPPCNTGFSATKGWDPASGWGSVDYVKMHKTIVALGSANGAIASPTVRPTARLYAQPPVAGYKVPTNKPTSFPTRRRKNTIRFPTKITETEVTETVYTKVSAYIQQAISVLYSPYSSSAAKSSSPHDGPIRATGASLRA